MKIKPVYLLIFIFLSISCNDNFITDEITLERISDNYRAYTLFLAGSKWTYEEETSKETTQILVDSNFQYIGVNTIGNTNEIDFQYEAFEMFLDKNNLLGFSKYEIAATKENPEASEMTSLLRLFIDDKYHTIFQPCFPFGDTVEIGTVSGNYLNIGYYENFQIGQHNFSKVYHTKILDSFNPEGKEVFEFYLSPGIGIIRFTRETILHEQSWNLTDWDVKQ